MNDCAGLSYGENMPRKPKVPCRHPGCSELVEPGELYCKKHRTQHIEEINRPSAAKRGYSRAWYKFSKQYLKAHPLCVRCLAKGIYTKATVLDHIKPFRGDMELFWDLNNLQPLCKPCHDRKTFTEDNHPVYKY